MSKRFLFTIFFFSVILVGTLGSMYYAKGYRFSPDTRTINGTGILSITSVPDQASIYLDNRLVTASNTNINSLTPKTYDVRIEKEGYISWIKKVEVKESLVTKIKATLFRSIPSIYPLTYTGIENISLSPNEQKLVYVVPSKDTSSIFENRRSGIWVWNLNEKALAFTRGSEPFQIAYSEPGVDYAKAKFRWSPDSSQILVTLPDRSLLLDVNKLNNPPRDITAILQATLRVWEEDEKTRLKSRMDLIRDPNFYNIASSSAFVKWSPDESRLLYSEDGKENFKILDLFDRKTFDLPGAHSYHWLADSGHLILVTVDKYENSGNEALSYGKISVIEYDGFNQAVVYEGQFNPDAVFVWPDDSRLLIVSQFPATGNSRPNLFGVNIK
jgi:hypothetical protein